jgi:uncharacterized membrane protein
MAIMLGGAAIVAVGIGQGDRAEEPVSGRLELARRYERIFWPILTLQVLTGVGQLGIFGDVLPGPQTAWGGHLMLKLELVIGLVLASLLRTMILVRLVAQPDARLTKAGARGLSLLYWATVLGFGVVVLAAANLAHG